MVTNSSIPYLDSSLPNPLFLLPPNGILGSETMALLTDTISDFMMLDNNSIFLRSCVHHHEVLEHFRSRLMVYQI